MFMLVGERQDFEASPVISDAHVPTLIEQPEPCV